MTQEVYEKYRRSGKLSLVIENLKKLLSLGNSTPNSHLKIRTALIANCHIEHQIEEYQAYMKELNVDEYSVDNLQVDPNLKPILVCHPIQSMFIKATVAWTERSPPAKDFGAK